MTHLSPILHPLLLSFLTLSFPNLSTFPFCLPAYLASWKVDWHPSSSSSSSSPFLLIPNLTVTHHDLRTLSIVTQAVNTGVERDILPRFLTPWLSRHFKQAFSDKCLLISLKNLRKYLNSSNSMRSASSYFWKQLDDEAIKNRGFSPSLVDHKTRAKRRSWFFHQKFTRVLFTSPILANRVPLLLH